MLRLSGEWSVIDLVRSRLEVFEAMHAKVRLVQLCTKAMGRRFVPLFRCVVCQPGQKKEFRPGKGLIAVTTWQSLKVRV